MLKVGKNVFVHIFTMSGKQVDIEQTLFCKQTEKESKKHVFIECKEEKEKAVKHNAQEEKRKTKKTFILKDGNKPILFLCLETPEIRQIMRYDTQAYKHTATS